MLMRPPLHPLRRLRSEPLPEDDAMQREQISNAVATNAAAANPSGRSCLQVTPAMKDKT